VVVGVAGGTCDWGTEFALRRRGAVAGQSWWELALMAIRPRPCSQKRRRCVGWPRFGSQLGQYWQLSQRGGS
jgi:hypothetical protein